MSQVPQHATTLEYAEVDVGVVDRAGFVQQPAAGGGVIVAGVCPRCFGTTATEYGFGLPGTGTKGGLFSWRRQSAPAPAPDVIGREVHFCECRHPHPGLPADTAFVGCGASWRAGAVPVAGGTP
ncbi:hypothetical protein [Streptomyces sp. NPDC046887]|uniref:hypothetical protein n=1 Tax=Streptomyces sp. NPDC046887 TaxID=3155472 RepID=UPI0033F9CE27